MTRRRVSQVEIGDFYFSLYEASERCHPERRRREGPGFPQLRRTYLRGRRVGIAGPALAPFAPNAPSVLKQVLRSRAFRALAQDDTPPRALKREGWNLSWMPRLPDPATREVFPGGVPLFNELDFSGADPALDLFLAGNSGANLREPFEIDQPSDVVLAREPGDQATLVLIYSSHDVVGDPRVQDTRATGHDVHAVAAHDLLQS